MKQILLSTLLSFSHSQNLDVLPALNANPNTITISGFSAGAYMANQMHIIYSQQIKGAAMVAGGPYQIIESSYSELIKDDAELDRKVTIDKEFLKLPRSLNDLVDKCLERVYISYLAGLIDDPENIRHSPVFVGIDTKDDIVVPIQQQAQRQFYQNLSSLVMAKEYDVMHEIDMKSNVIGTYLTFLLSHIQGTGFEGHQQPQADQNWEKLGTLTKFNQTEFIKQGWFRKTNMQEFGYVYCPNACNPKKPDVSCNLHISLHGCDGDWQKWIFRYDFLQQAAANNIIMLFPLNRNCWDFYGFTSGQYATKNGIQPSAIMNMVKRVISTDTAKSNTKII